MDRRELLALLGGTGLAGFACRPDKGPGDPSLQRAQSGPPYQFKALDAHQAATVAVLVDCIIPATETPGAAAAGVPEFIDVIVGEWYQPDERAQFLAGLSELDQRSAAVRPGRFLDLDNSQQVALLETVEAEAFAARKAGTTTRRWAPSRNSTGPPSRGASTAANTSPPPAPEGSDAEAL